MQVKILSWNIWVDCHIEQVKELLQNSNADIIGLQEVREDDPSRETIKFMGSLGYNHIFAPVSKTWGGKVWTYGPAIFTKHKLISSVVHILSEKENCLAVQADIEIGGNILHTFSSHLSHTHQQDSSVQLHQVQELVGHIPSKRSILMGDFNAIPASQTIQIVKETLIDADPKNQPTWSVYPEGCIVCKPQKINIRLDYIFTTKDINTYSYKVESSKGSDHLPISVIAEI